MHFLSDELDIYVTHHSENEPELLAQLNKETHQKVLQPRMLSGHFQGRVLSILSKIIHPTNILEIGTYTGYATLCLAEGLAQNGTIDTIDNEEELFDFQRKYYDKSQWKDQIFQHLGNGLDVIPKRSEEHTSELQSRRLISYAVFCLKKNFFNDTATTEIYTRPYTLSLHDALPIFYFLI